MILNEIARLFAKTIINTIVIIRKYVWSYGIVPLTFDVIIYKKLKVKILKYGQLSQLIYSHQPLIRFDRGFEFETFSVIEQNINKGDIIFDIGANIGVHSIFISKILDNNCKIYAFEPNPDTFKVLVKNLELNYCKNVIPINKALSDKAGKMYLEISKGDAFANIQSEKKGLSTVEIEVDTLDNFMIDNKIDNVNFVKIDVEGAELFCINGMKHLFKENDCKIVIETADSLCGKYNYTSFDVLSNLSSFGYNFINYEWAQWLAEKNK
jgi:FkbM family methyltransferase